MILPTADRLGTVEEYYFSRKLKEIAALRAAGHEVLNLGIGSPDLPPAPAVVRTLVEAAQRPDVHAYQSYVGLPELRAAIAAWYARWYAVSLDPATEVLPMIGSKEAIMHLSMTYLQADDVVLVPDPGYPTYQAVSRLTGAEMRTYALRSANNYQIDLEALRAQDLSRVKLCWINYPHMPTGRPADPAVLGELITLARTHNFLIVNDNPYSHIGTDQPFSILQLPGARAVAVELNSLSKSHNMAGWRMGMLVGKAELIQPVLRFKSNMDSGQFKPAQLAAITALELGADWYAAQNATYARRRRSASRLLEQLGCTVEPDQQGLFVWARVPSQYADGYALSDAVLDQARVFITPGGIFGAAGAAYLRISLCAPESTYAVAAERLAAASWAQ